MARPRANGNPIVPIPSVLPRRNVEVGHKHADGEFPDRVSSRRWVASAATMGLAEELNACRVHPTDLDIVVTGQAVTLNPGRSTPFFTKQRAL